MYLYIYICHYKRDLICSCSDGLVKRLIFFFEKIYIRLFKLVEAVPINTSIITHIIRYFINDKYDVHLN